MPPRPVARLSDILDESPVLVDVDGTPVCLVRVEGEVKAIHDVCSHEEYGLHEGIVWGRSIECALHGSTFDLDTGAPESLPATTPVPVYPVTIVGDEVHVDVEAQLNDAPVPIH